MKQRHVMLWTLQDSASRIWVVDGLLVMRSQGI